MDINGPPNTSQRRAAKGDKETGPDTGLLF